MASLKKPIVIGAVASRDDSRVACCKATAPVSWHAAHQLISPDFTWLQETSRASSKLSEVRQLQQAAPHCTAPSRPVHQYIHTPPQTGWIFLKTPLWNNGTTASYTIHLHYHSPSFFLSFPPSWYSRISSLLLSAGCGLPDQWLVWSGAVILMR